MNSYLKLFKIRISFLVALTSATAFVIASNGISISLFNSSLGVFLLAAGASALNQIQENKIDAMMERTMARPIPSGEIPVSAAWSVSIAVMVAGLLFLLFSGLLPAAFGIFAVVWYNGFYTPLKKKSAFAGVPGSLTGAIPPLIGWTAAGGTIADPRIAAISIFVFLWQVPHFWILILTYGNEYERAGLPVLSRVLSQRQIKRIVFVWILSSASAGLILPFFGLINSVLISLILTAGTAYLIFSGTKIFKEEGNEKYFPVLFRDINIYAAVVMVLLMVDVLI